jgi:putative acetyltransferase
MYKFRKARKGEESKIFELVKTVLADYQIVTNANTPDKDLSDLDKLYFNSNGWFTVIEKDTEIIGSYGLHRINSNICELRKMYLLTEYQGQGLGKLMMEDALKKAKELGYRQIVLESNKLLEKALNLYRKYGFAEYIPDLILDRYDVAMTKML